MCRFYFNHQCEVQGMTEGYWSTENEIRLYPSEREYCNAKNMQILNDNLHEMLKELRWMSSYLERITSNMERKD